MKKLVAILILCLLCLFCAVGFAACSCDGCKAKEEYTATIIVDGETVGTRTFNATDKVIADLPEVPAKEGYTGKWVYEIKADNITVAAVYTAITYNATFMVDGVSIATKPFTVEDTEIKDMPEVPKKERCIGKWQYKITASDITVTAFYIELKENEFYATIVADGKTLGERIFSTDDSEIKDLPEVPAKDGYTGKWEYEIKADNITVVAVYVAITYNATFIVDGVSITTKPFTVEDTEIKDLPEVPAKDGYTGSWQYKIIADNITVIAVYVAITYNATFIVDGVNIATKPFTVEDTEIKDLPEVPAKDGYTGSWQYKITADNITVIAVYVAITYNATFIVDGVNIGTRTFTVEDIEIKDLPAVPAKEGYIGKWKYEIKADDIIVVAVYTTIQHEHNYVETIVVEPTCTTGGYTLYRCDCEDEYKDNETSALGHDYGAWTVTTTPTCTTAGVETRYCSRDSVHTETREVPATGHTPANAVEENYVAPTCVNNGGYDSVVYCSVCGVEISRETIVIPELGHTPASAVEENYTAPDCIHSGRYDSVVYCSTCEEEISRETIVIPELGHTPASAIEENYVAPDCTNDGSYDSVVYCSTCGVELSRETIVIPATGHIPDGVAEENHVAPDCIHSGGYDLIKCCSVCGAEISRKSVILNPTGVHNYENGICSVCGAQEPINPNDYYTRNGDYIYFGTYPQSDVTATKSNELSSYVQTKPANGNNNGWTSYNYYINGSNDTDFMWYKDVDVDNNGTKDYRAVYFTSYRPYGMGNGSLSTYQGDNGYYTSNVYWFKYEPIKWRILIQEDNTAIILAELILDSHDYSCNEYFLSTINNQTVQVNNYEYSSIRAWLNDNFYNTAFNENEKAIINTIEVDNSVRSTNPDNNATYWNSGTNNYACENTYDKVWLLSVQEATKAEYGFDESPEAYGVDSTRIRKPSAYAQCQGAWTNTSSDYLGNGRWWLRSPYYGAYCYSLFVSSPGTWSHGYVDTTSVGVVPALQISLASEQTDPVNPPIEPQGDLYVIDGDYIYFGTYPQSDVTATKSNELSAYVQVLPTKGYNNGWTSYNYYISGSNTTDFMWYKDVDVDSNGTKDYRAVYFTSYRPYQITVGSSTDKTYQDTSGYNTSSVYWFKYEPIKWRILSQEDNTAIILAELILDSQNYNYTYNSRTIDNKTVYANNYAYSSIRAWLNDNFYNTAFNEYEKAIINTIEVDNNARSTNPDNNATYWNNGVNNYACENTYDKVWLLSEQEVTKAEYGFNEDPWAYDVNNTRIRKTSAYAKCQGLPTGSKSSIYSGNGRWLLRSPYFNGSLDSWGINEAGQSFDHYDVNYTYVGVVPALQISLA